MTFHIHTSDGDYTVSTEVGDGLARVVVERDEPPVVIVSIEPGET